MLYNMVKAAGWDAQAVARPIRVLQHLGRPLSMISSVLVHQLPHTRPQILREAYALLFAGQLLGAVSQSSVYPEVEPDAVPFRSLRTAFLGHSTYIIQYSGLYVKHPAASLRLGVE